MKLKALLVRISLAIVLIFASVGLFKIGRPTRVYASALERAAPINVCGGVTTSTTWTTGNIYVADGCTVWIDAGATLTIQAGAIVKMSGASLTVNGGLTMTGTAGNPAVITSYKDDAHGGDTNGDGPSTASPGDWVNIQINPGATLRLSNCDIGYAGSYGASPALNVTSGDVQVSDCRIHDNNQDGVSIHGTDLQPVFENVQVNNNIGYGYLVGYECCTVTGTKPSITGGTVSNNGKTGIFLSRYTAAMAPIIKNMTISGNQGDGIYIEWNGQKPQIENSTFTGNTSAAVRMHPNSSPSVSSLTMSGNGVNALVVDGGNVGGGRTWDIDPLTPVQVLGDVTINDTQYLSLPPGITLKIGSGISMNVLGSLYAIGSAAQPVKFTGLTDTSGSWKQIYVAAQGKAIFQNCDIGYGGGAGSSTYPMLYLWADQPVIVQNCRIHHSAGDGIETGKNTAIIHNNEIYSNTAMGLRKSYGPPAINVIDNWWGDISGPYNASLNPTGTGNEVGNGSDAIFTPWLTSAPGAGQTVAGVILDTAGPSRISPGQTTEFAIHYTNLTDQTIENAVLLMQLPRGADYLESSSAGIHWSERDQVFWRLGSLLPGANASVSVRVRFLWGLPIDYQDGTITILAGSNYNQTGLDVSPYLSYVPILATGQTLISEANFTAERLASVDLQTFYAAAIADGYAYNSAYHMTFDNSQSATIATLVRSSESRAFTFLMRSGDKVLSMTIDRTLFTLQDATGLMTMTIPTGSTDWDTPIAKPIGSPTTDVSLAKPILSQIATACTFEKCRSNCWTRKVTWAAIGRLGASAAAAVFVYGWAPPASIAAVTYTFGKFGFSVLQCSYDCLDPSTHCCNSGEVSWSSNSIVRLTNQCIRSTCNSNSTWTLGVPEQCTSFGRRCVVGIGSSGGCKSCSEEQAGSSQKTVCSASSVGGKPNCRDLDNRLAHDPNELIGPDGDLLPGELVTYKITYENMGEGTAYGVYVTDILDDSFDFDSITADASTILLPASRLLVWNVGELAPKGESGSTGEMTFTVRLKSGLPGGTVISNQATVYFPSVPEVTPTNAVVNMIQPVAAIPQSLSTLAGQPVSITLSGRDAGGNPLTYTLVDPPLYGQLSGSAPNLTYTPAPNFIGSDVFTFQASNTVSHSRSAEVFIAINPNPADVTPPQVVWTSPVNGSANTPVNRTPIYTDDTGPLYEPVIAMGLSEPLDPATVTTTTVKLADAAKHTILADVAYYASLNQIFLTPRQALKSGATYSVQVTKGLKDLVGNPLASEYKFSFRMAGSNIYLPLVRR